MKQGENFDNNLIVRFLMREASANDIQLLEDWIASDEGNKNYFDQIRNTWNSIELERELDELTLQGDLNNVMEQIGIQQSHNSFLEKKSSKIKGGWLVKAAAIFVLGFAASWYIFQKFPISDSNEITFNVIETPKGSRATILLPDGSKVLLNADSKLIYPQKFTDLERKVELEGEAFFDIEKDASRQFLVKTSEITVKVFGTSFNVKSYPDDNTAEATLVEGSISIFKNTTNGEITGTELKLEPNQRIVLYKEQEKGTVLQSKTNKVENLPARKPKLVLSKRIDTDKFISWIDGQLKIKSEPMQKLAVTLERRYDVKIHFENEEVKQYKFTGAFKNETIEQVMAAIKIASSIDYRIDERNIWISKQNL